MSRSRAWVVAGCLGGVVGAALVVRWAARAEPAQLRWTQADLARADDDNGWKVLEHLDRVPNPSDELADWLSVVAQPDVASSWNEAPSAKVVFDFLRDPEVAAALEAWHAAAGQPTFADDCPLELGSTCPDYRIFVLHRIAAVEVLGHLLTEDWSAAVIATRQMLDVSASYAASARTLLGAMTALGSYDLALSMAELVHHAAPRTDGEPAHAAPLRDALVRHAAAEPTLRSAVIGEYVLITSGIGLLGASPSASSSDDNPLPRWLYDRDRTLHRVNAIFDEYMIAAEGGEIRAQSDGPSPGTLTDRMFNPVGEQLLGAILPGLFLSQCERHREQLADIRTRRARLIEQR